MAPLYKKPAEFKKVLNQKTQSNLDWKKYLESYLNNQEKDELKKDQTLPPEKIAEMLLSPNEAPAGPLIASATGTTNQSGTAPGSTPSAAPGTTRPPSAPAPTT
jgi:hypothetical protein